VAKMNLTLCFVFGKTFLKAFKIPSFFPPIASIDSLKFPFLGSPSVEIKNFTPDRITTKKDCV